jgi:hypothetical protein
MALSLALLTGSVASAGVRRVIFQGSEAAANVSAQQRGAGYQTPVGENLSATCPTCVPGGSSSPNWGAGVPNQIVTYLHPYTNKAVTIPLTLPVGKPRVSVRRDRVIYDYGLLSTRITVLFKERGVVEVVYRD